MLWHRIEYQLSVTGEALHIKKSSLCANLNSVLLLRNPNRQDLSLTKIQDREQQ